MQQAAACDTKEENKLQRSRESECLCALILSLSCAARGRVPFLLPRRGFQDAAHEMRMRLHGQFASRSFHACLFASGPFSLFKLISLWRLHIRDACCEFAVLRAPLYWLHRKTHNHPAQWSRENWKFYPSRVIITRVPTHQLCRSTVQSQVTPQLSGG